MSYRAGWVWFIVIMVVAFAAVPFSYADMPLFAVGCGAAAVKLTLHFGKLMDGDRSA